jgi:drug/metabolite transporter (DMT)-like permease
MNTKLVYTIIIHVVVLIWGYTGIMGKAIDLGATVMVWWRLLFGVAALLLLFPFLQKKRAAVSRKTALKILFVGGVVGLHWLTFFESIKMSSVSLGIICLATTTIHVSWLEPLMKGTKFKKTDLVLSLVVLFGMLLIGSREGAHLPAILVGLLSAFLAALFSVSNAVLVEKTPAVQLTVMELASGFVLISLVLLFQGKIDAQLFVMDTKLLWQLLFLGVVCTAIAFVLAVNATKHLGAFTVSLTINLEPVYTILLALLYFPESEKMEPRFYIGAAIILAAVIGNSFIKRQQRRSKIKALQQSAVV